MARTVPPRRLSRATETPAAHGDPVPPANSDPAPRTRRRKERPLALRILLDAVLYLAIPVAAIAAWWVFSLDSGSPYFPPLPEILARFRELWLFDLFFSDVVPSLARMFAGFALGVVAGVALGIVCGRIKPVYRALSPFIHFGRAVPAIAILPIAMIILGVGDLMKVVLLAVACLFPVLLNTIDAVSSVDRGFEDVARTFQFTRLQRLLFVLIPFAAPRIFTGARISLSVALIMVIATEMFAATNGVGYLTIQAQQNFNIRSMWAGMLLLGLLGVAFNIIFIRAQRRAIPWTSNTPER